MVLLKPGKASLVHDLTIQSPPKMPTHSDYSGEVCLFLGREIAPPQEPSSPPPQIPPEPWNSRLRSTSAHRPPTTRYPTPPPSVFTHQGQQHPPDLNVFSPLPMTTQG